MLWQRYIHVHVIHNVWAVMSVCLSVCLSIHLSVHPSVCSFPSLNPFTSSLLSSLTPSALNSFLPPPVLPTRPPPWAFSSVCSCCRPSRQTSMPGASTGPRPCTRRQPTGTEVCAHVHVQCVVCAVHQQPHSWCSEAVTVLSGIVKCNVLSSLGEENMYMYTTCTCINSVCACTCIHEVHVGMLSYMYIQCTCTMYLCPTESLEYLLACGCHADDPAGPTGATALHYVAAAGHGECVQVLLQYGASANSVVVTEEVRGEGGRKGRKERKGVYTCTYMYMSILLKDKRKGYGHPQ